MSRIKLTLAYTGTRFAGWQLQASRKPTIQGELERALTELLGERIPVFGAGRTDAGVHAEAQVCHFDVPGKPPLPLGNAENFRLERREALFDEGHEDGLDSSVLPPEAHYSDRAEQRIQTEIHQRFPRIDWVRALNTRLPADIRVLEAENTAPDFHARMCATRKEYAYALWMGASRAVPRIDPFVWSVPVLDMPAMEAAASHLVGLHDFASFRNAGIPRNSGGGRRDGEDNTVRTVYSITPRQGMAGPLSCPPHWPVMTWHVEGDGFLRQMVRNVMGLLVWAGQGKIAPERIPALMASRRREALPTPCAPAQGLTMMRVFY